MTKNVPVELPSITFSTKKSAIKFFKDMLGRYKNGDHINQIDSIYLFELTLRHPEEKIGNGVAYFYKDKNLEYPTSGFHIQRKDGSKTDFSYLKCIGEKSHPPESTFIRRVALLYLAIYQKRKTISLIRGRDSAHKLEKL